MVVVIQAPRRTNVVPDIPALGTELGTHASHMRELNPHLSVSVSAPPDAASIDLIAEGSESCCPWNTFQVRFEDITTVNRSDAWGDVRPKPGEAPRERSSRNRKANANTTNEVEKHSENAPEGLSWRAWYPMWNKDIQKVSSTSTTK